MLPNVRQMLLLANAVAGPVPVAVSVLIVCSVLRVLNLYYTITVNCNKSTYTLALQINGHQEPATVNICYNWVDCFRITGMT